MNITATRSISVFGRDDFVTLSPSSLFTSTSFGYAGQLTVATPSDSDAIVWKAAVDRSRQRPTTYGPRSLIRTTTDLPVAASVTCTRVLNGKVRCAGEK